MIGCTLLVQPVFFPRDAWVPQPGDWKAPIQKSKRYDLAVSEGLRVWESCIATAHDLELTPRVIEDPRSSRDRASLRRFGDRRTTPWPRYIPNRSHRRIPTGLLCNRRAFLASGRRPTPASPGGNTPPWPASRWSASSTLWASDATNACRAAGVSQSGLVTGWWDAPWTTPFVGLATEGGFAVRLEQSLM